MSGDEVNTLMAKDPVCGMQVDPRTARGQAEHRGKTYYFCNSNCEKRFREAPAQYTALENQTFKILSAPAKSALDPVCGMSVDPTNAAASVDFQGQKYYFCCRSCADRFASAPERFLGRTGPTKAAAAMAPAQTRTADPLAKTDYICPMDPEVISDKPGSCPVCGMASSRALLHSRIKVAPSFTK